MPPQGPERYEAGTQNVAGIAALGQGVRFIMDTGVDAIMAREASLANRIIEGLSSLPKAILYGPLVSDDRSGVVSFNIDGMESQDVALALDTGFDIAVRAGLHCAPDTHALLGTLNSGGTVRVSPGFFNTESDIDTFLHAVEEISA
jgi:selenocysteine lyase/cysteine desulfurase